MSVVLRPRKIRLEASTLCQLKCPSCSAAKGKTEAVIGKGYLKFKNFKNLLDVNPYIREIELSNYGEIFLNPELSPIIKYADGKNIRLMAENGVNLNAISDETLESLVKYRFRVLSVSIDGASDQTYSQYRVGGDFHTVIANLQKLNSFKKQYASSYPKLIWQFVIFGHNEHELPLARQMASDLGARFIPKLSWDSNFSPIKNPEFVKLKSGLRASNSEEDQEICGPEYGASFCRMLWREPQINWDGKILGCCCNYWKEFTGNAFTDGLVESLNSESIAYARLMLQGITPSRPDIPCTTCDLYLERARTNKWLRPKKNRAMIRIKQKLNKLRRKFQGCIKTQK